MPDTSVMATPIFDELVKELGRDKGDAPAGEAPEGTPPGDDQPK